jgi:U32 family peptidase
MIICTPLHSAEDVEDLVEAGAGEFYAGIDIPEWKDRYSIHIEMNRRGFLGGAADLKGLDGLAEAVERAHAFHTPLLLAVNHLQYTAAQIPVLRKLLTDCRDIGVDGFILSDLNLILIARQLGLRVAVGVTAASANYYSYAFYKQLGVFRIIANRDMQLEELEAMRTAFPDLGMEVFMLGNRCKFTDGACFTLHDKDRGAFCNLLKYADWEVMTHSGKAVPFAVEAMFIRNHTEFAHFYRRNTCGLCSMWRLIRMGVDCCKLVGRELPADRIKSELRGITRTIRIAREAVTEDEFFASLQPPSEDSTFCSYGYKCFFPQLRRPSLLAASNR